MSLPTSQQRVLERIESDLEGCEPRLVSMFSIFTRLTRNEEAPRTESLPPGTSLKGLRRIARPRAIVAVPLLLVLLGMLVFLTVSSSSTAHACPGTQPRVTSCQSASKLQNHAQAVPTAGSRLAAGEQLRVLDDRGIWPEITEATSAAPAPDPGAAGVTAP
ncbi:MAG: hypothetical protein ACRDOB_11945 [Streptosporangiaceae bacterium]